MPTITLGTFNINNLFSRFSFQGDYDAAEVKGTDKAVSFPDGTYTLRQYKGKLVRGKPDKDRRAIAQRIQKMNADVLAVQEVEDIDTLTYFVRSDLAGLYRHVVLVEGNDERLIDVAVLSKLPFGAVRSWRFAVHPNDPARSVFSRDLLEVEVLSQDRSVVLFTLFNTHLKSQLVPWNAKDKKKEKANNDARRLRQTETIERIILERQGAKARFAVVGDFNDQPASPTLAPVATSQQLQLLDALANATETATINDPNGAPSSPVWTHRFKESHKPARYELYDQIWLSGSLAGGLKGAQILRRSKLGGDGSDHDPAWISLAV